MVDIVRDLNLIIVLLFLVVFFWCKYYSIQKKLINERNSFINTLSHDLRIAAIAQMRGVDLLKKYISKEAFSENLIPDITNCSKYLLELINLLINTYKFENGENILNYETFNPNDELDLILREITVKAKEKSLKIIFTNDISNVYADKSNILKVINILIDTALAYSYESNVIECFLCNHKNNLKFELRYTGKFLTEEEQKRMFSNNPRYSVVGHGIQMYFCKKIIEFHKGKVFANCKKDNKNYLGFTIPMGHKQISKNTAITTFLNANECKLY